MVSIPRFGTPSPEWDAAFVGAMTSLPTNVVVDWSPNSEAAVGAGMMISGAVTAGVTVAVRSMDSDATGLYAGSLGGALELVIFVMTTGATVTRPLSGVVFFVFAGRVVVYLAPMFGLGYGWIGGWLMQTVGSQ